MEDYSDILSGTVLAASVSLLSIMEDHSPPSSLLHPQQEQQKVVEQDEGEEENLTWSKAAYVWGFGPRRQHIILLAEIALGKMTKASWYFF